MHRMRQPSITSKKYLELEPEGAQAAAAKAIVTLGTRHIAQRLLMSSRARSGATSSSFARIRYSPAPAQFP
jgi:hypothetical protein